MSQALDFIGVLLHTFGLLIFAGGQIWVIFIMKKAEKSPRPHGKAFVPEIQPSIGRFMMVGILLLLVGGLIRMVSTNRPDFWGDTGGIWGLSMVIKHILFSVLVILGCILVFKITPTAGKLAPKGPDEKPSPEFLKTVKMAQKMAMLLVMLDIIIIILGVTASTLG